MLITGKEAQLILGITTRQGLHKLVHKHNIEFKGQGNGKSNLYKKEDIEKLKEIVGPLKQKTEIKKKILKREKIIENNKEINKKAMTPKSDDNWNIVSGKENIDKALKEMEEKAIAEEQKKVEVQNRPDEYYLSKDILTKDGQIIFDKLREELIANGTYQDKDIALLQAYCVSYQKYINAINRSAEFSDTTMDDFGNLKVHPYFQVADKCLSQMDKLAKALGIGVKNRVGLEIAKPKKETIFDILNSKEF